MPHIRPLPTSSVSRCVDSQRDNSLVAEGREASGTTFPVDRPLDRVVTWMFLGCIWLPLLLMIFFPSLNSNRENRALAPFPGTGGTKISFQQLDEYLTDHLGLRSVFIEAHNRLKLAAFRTTDQKVLFGQDDWLFYNAGATVAAFTGDIVCTAEDKERWCRTLQQRADYLAQRDIPYGLIAVPDKQFVYPEKMPHNVVQEAGHGYTDTLLQAIGEEVNVITLLEALHSAKVQGQVYYPKDTHWNGRGMAAGYQALIEQLTDMVPAFAEETPCPLEIVTLEDCPRCQGLDNLVGGQTTIQPTILAVPNRANARLAATPQEYLQLEEYYQQKEGAIQVYVNPSEHVQGRRLVMFHTSFSIGCIRSLLAEHFERAVFIRHSPPHFLAFHKSLVEQEKPTLVLNEIPTRYLTLDPTTAYCHQDWFKEGPDKPLRVSRQDRERR